MNRTAKNANSGVYSLWLSHENISRLDDSLQSLAAKTSRKVSRSQLLDHILARMSDTEIRAAVRLASGLPRLRRKKFRRRIYHSAAYEVRPFISYYGSKHFASKIYPEPRYPTLIEPFAGGASYSLLHHEKNVWLNDSNDHVTAVWEWLLTATEEQFLALPDDPDPSLSQAENWMIGWRLGRANVYPRHQRSGWCNNEMGSRWSPRVREQLAAQLKNIRHWKVTQGSYLDLPDIEATWFIDPPYQLQGHRYRHGSKKIDFKQLGEWCRSRKGQVLVCESEGADWLPFTPLQGWKPRQNAVNGRTAREMIWMNDADPVDIFERIARLG